MKRLGKKTKELIKSEWETIKINLIIKFNKLNHLSN